MFKKIKNKTNKVKYINFLEKKIVFVFAIQTNFLFQDVLYMNEGNETKGKLIFYRIFEVI